jgi:hypothetical protein
MTRPVLNRSRWWRGRAALTRSRCASPTSPASGRGNKQGPASGRMRSVNPIALPKEREYIAGCDEVRIGHRALGSSTRYSRSDSMFSPI